MFKTWLKQFLAVFICLFMISSTIIPAYANTYDYKFASASSDADSDSDTAAQFDANYYIVDKKAFKKLFDFGIKDLKASKILDWVFDFKSYTVIKRYQYEGEDQVKCYFNTPNLQSIIKNQVTSIISDGYTDNTYDVNETQWIVDVGKKDSTNTDTDFNVNVITRYGFDIPSYTYMGEYPKEVMTLAGIVPGVEEKWWETLWRAIKALFGCSFLKAPTADNFNTITYLNHTYTEKADYIREFFKKYYVPYLEGQLIASKAYDLGNDSDSARENAAYFDSPEEVMALTTTKAAYRSAKNYNDDHSKFYKEALQHYIWWKAYTENKTGDESDTDSTNDGYSFTNMADGKWLDENNWPPDTDTDSDFRAHLINFDFLDNDATSDSDIYSNADVSTDVSTDNPINTKAAEIMNLIIPGANKWSVVENSKVEISADIYPEAKSDMMLDGWHFIASRERYREKVEDWLTVDPNAVNNVKDAYIYLNSIPNDSDTDSDHAIFRTQYDGEQEHNASIWSYTNQYSKLTTPETYGLTTTGLTTPQAPVITPTGSISSTLSDGYENYEYLQVASITADILRYSYDYLKCHFLYDVQEKYTIKYQKKVDRHIKTWTTYDVELEGSVPNYHNSDNHWHYESSIKCTQSYNGMDAYDNNFTESDNNDTVWSADNTRPSITVNWYTKESDKHTDMLYKDLITKINNNININSDTDIDTQLNNYFSKYLGQQNIHIDNNSSPSTYNGVSHNNYLIFDSTDVTPNNPDANNSYWDVNRSIPNEYHTDIDTNINDLESDSDTDISTEVDSIHIGNIQFSKNEDGSVICGDRANPMFWIYNDSAEYNGTKTPVLYRDDSFSNSGIPDRINHSFTIPVDKFEKYIREQESSNDSSYYDRLYRKKHIGGDSYSFCQVVYKINIKNVVKHKRVHITTHRRYLIKISTRKSNYRYQYMWDGKNSSNKVSDAYNASTNADVRGPTVFLKFLREFDFNRFKDIDLSNNLAYNPSSDSDIDTDTEITSTDTDTDTSTDAMSKAINRYLAKKDPREKNANTFNLDDIVPQDLQAIYLNYEHNVQLISNYKKFNNYIGRGLYYDNEDGVSATTDTDDNVENIRTLPYRQCMIENKGSDNECWSDEYGDDKTSITLANVIVYSDVYKVTGEGDNHIRYVPTDSDYDDTIEDKVNTTHHYQYRNRSGLQYGELTDAEATAILNRLQEYCGPYYPQVVSNMIKLMIATANYENKKDPANFTLKDDPRIMPYDTGTMLENDTKHYEVKDPRVELYKNHIVGGLVSNRKFGGSIAIYLKIQPKIISLAGKLTEISVFLQSICNFKIFEDNGLSPTEMWKEKAYADLAIMAIILLWLVKTIIAIFKLGKNGSIRILIAAFVVLLEIGAISSITGNPTPTWTTIKNASEKIMFLGSIESADRDQNGIGYLFGSSSNTKNYEVFYYLPYLDIWSKYNTGYGLLEPEQKMNTSHDIEINSKSSFKNPKIFGTTDIQHYSILLADSFSFYGKSDSVMHSSMINGVKYNGLTINNNAYRVVDHFMAPRVEVKYSSGSDAFSLKVTENELYNGEFQGALGSVITKFANCLLGCFLSIIKVMMFVYFWWQLYIFTFNILLGIGVERKKLSTILAETFMPVLAICLFDMYSNICLTIGMQINGIVGLFIIIFMFWLTIIIIRWWHDLNNGLLFPFTLNWIYALSSLTAGNKLKAKRRLELETELAYKNVGINLDKDHSLDDETDQFFNADGSIRTNIDVNSADGRKALTQWYKHTQNYINQGYVPSDKTKLAISRFEQDDRFKEDIVNKYKGKRTEDLSKKDSKIKPKDDSDKDKEESRSDDSKKSDNAKFECKYCHLKFDDEEKYLKHLDECICKPSKKKKK